MAKYGAEQSGSAQTCAHLGQNPSGECRSGQEEQWRYTSLIMILNLIFDQNLARWGYVGTGRPSRPLPADNKAIKQ